MTLEQILSDAKIVAEWHIEDGDECGDIARRLFAAIAWYQSSNPPERSGSSVVAGFTDSARDAR